MKLKQRVSDNVSKSVTYYGYQLLVPKSTTHVATDGDGQTYAYIGPPDYDRKLDCWFGDAVVGVIAIFDLETLKASQTLVEVAK